MDRIFSRAAAASEMTVKPEPVSIAKRNGPTPLTVAETTGTDTDVKVIGSETDSAPYVEPQAGERAAELDERLDAVPPLVVELRRGLEEERVDLGRLLELLLARRDLAEQEQEVRLVARDADGALGEAKALGEVPR